MHYCEADDLDRCTQARCINTSEWNVPAGLANNRGDKGWMKRQGASSQLKQSVTHQTALHISSLHPAQFTHLPCGVKYASIVLLSGHCIVLAGVTQPDTHNKPTTHKPTCHVTSSTHQS
jgi:hypothetical protein